MGIPRPRLTVAQLELVIASLHGLRITGVDYAPLTDSADEHGTFDWDYEGWHEPTMGIQLNTDIGAVYTLTWGSDFGCYGLEVHARGIKDFLAPVGEPSGPVILPVHEHPRWQPLLGREISGTQLEWVVWDSSDRTPCWLRLDFAPKDDQPSNEPESAWISSGRWERDRFAFATDDVTVIFDRAEAARTKIMTHSSHRTGPRSPGRREGRPGEYPVVPGLPGSSSTA